jgi:hypothetical protein
MEVVHDEVERNLKLLVLHVDRQILCTDLMAGLSERKPSSFALFSGSIIALHVCEANGIVIVAGHFVDTISDF